VSLQCVQLPQQQTKKVLVWVGYQGRGGAMVPAAAEGIDHQVHQQATYLNIHVDYV
jgi:hypothetical protein